MSCLSREDFRRRRATYSYALKDAENRVLRLNDSTFYNPRWASEAQNVVTVEAIQTLSRSSSAAQSKFRDSSPSWRPGRVLKTRNMALWKAEERREDMLIPRSRKGDRLTVTRSSDPARVGIDRSSPGAARSF